MTLAILLAAGAGRRMGASKALLELGGEPAVRRCLRALAQGGCDEARVVLAEPVSTRPASDVVSVAPLPDLMALVSDLSAQVPHVVVHTDRTGADVEAFCDVLPGVVAEIRSRVGL